MQAYTRAKGQTHVHGGDLDEELGLTTKWSREALPGIKRGIEEQELSDQVKRPRQECDGNDAHMGMMCDVRRLLVQRALEACSMIVACVLKVQSMRVRSTGLRLMCVRCVCGDCSTRRRCV